LLEGFFTDELALTVKADLAVLRSYPRFKFLDISHVLTWACQREASRIRDGIWFKRSPDNMTCQRFFNKSKTALMRFLTIRNTADLIRDQFLDVVPDPTRTVDEQYLFYGTYDQAR